TNTISEHQDTVRGVVAHVVVLDLQAGCVGDEDTVLVARNAVLLHLDVANLVEDQDSAGLEAVDRRVRVDVSGDEVVFHLGPGHLQSVVRVAAVVRGVADLDAVLGNRGRRADADDTIVFDFDLGAALYENAALVVIVDRVAFNLDLPGGVGVDPET